MQCFGQIFIFQHISLTVDDDQSKRKQQTAFYDKIIKTILKQFKYFSNLNSHIQNPIQSFYNQFINFLLLSYKIFMKNTSTDCYCQSIIRKCLDLVPKFGFRHIDENILTISQCCEKQQNQDPFAEKQKVLQFQGNSLKISNQNTDIINRTHKKQRVKIVFNNKFLLREKYYQTSQWRMAKDVISILLFGRWSCPIITEKFVCNGVNPLQFIQQKLQYILFTYMNSIENLAQLIQSFHNERLTKFFEAKPAKHQHQDQFFHQPYQKKFQPFHHNKYNKMYTGYNSTDKTGQLGNKTGQLGNKSLQKSIRGYNNMNLSINTVINNNTRKQQYAHLRTGNIQQYRFFSPSQKRIKQKQRFKNEPFQQKDVYRASQKSQQCNKQPKIFANNFQPYYSNKLELTSNKSSVYIQQIKPKQFVNCSSEVKKAESQHDSNLNFNLIKKHKFNNAASFQKLDSKKHNLTINNQYASRKSCNSPHQQNSSNNKNKVVHNFGRKSQKQVPSNKQLFLRSDSDIQCKAQAKSKGIDNLMKKNKQIYKNNNKKYPPIPLNNDYYCPNAKSNQFAYHPSEKDKIRTQSAFQTQKNFQVFERSLGTTKELNINDLETSNLLQGNRKNYQILNFANVKNKSQSFSEWKAQLSYNDLDNKKKYMTSSILNIKPNIQGIIHNQTQKKKQQNKIQCAKRNSSQFEQNNPCKNQQKQRRNKNIQRYYALEQRIKGEYLGKVNKKNHNKTFDHSSKKNIQTSFTTTNKRLQNQNFELFLEKYQSNDMSKNSSNQNSAQVIDKYSKQSNRAMKDKNVIIQQQKNTHIDNIQYEQNRKENLLNKYLKGKKSDQETIKIKDSQARNKNFLQKPIQNSQKYKSYSNEKLNFKSKYIFQTRTKKYSDCIDYFPSQNNLYRNQRAIHLQKQQKKSNKEQQKQHTHQYQTNCLDAFQIQLDSNQKAFVKQTEQVKYPLLKKYVSAFQNERQQKLPSHPITQRQLSQTKLSLLNRDSQQWTQRLVSNNQKCKISQKTSFSKTDLDWKFNLDSGIQYNVEEKVAYKEAKFMQLKMEAKKLLF